MPAYEKNWNAKGLQVAGERHAVIAGRKVNVYQSQVGPDLTCEAQGFLMADREFEDTIAPLLKFIL